METGENAGKRVLGEGGRARATGEKADSAEGVRTEQEAGREKVRAPGTGQGETGSGRTGSATFRAL